MEDYEDVHKFFLRTIMHRGVLSEIDAERIIHNHCDGGDCDLKGVISVVNNAIKPFKHKIKTVINDTSGAKEVVFLTSGDDDAARCQIVFTPGDLDYFKFLLEEILISDDKIISGITAMNIASKVQVFGFSKTRAQELLDNWCQMHYLRKDATRGYCLGTRGIHEFDAYFQQNFTNAVDTCFLCNHTVFQVKWCLTCEKAFHNHCLNKYLAKIPKWPCCKEAFNETQSQSLTQSSQVSAHLSEESSSSPDQSHSISYTQESEQIESSQQSRRAGKRRLQ